jgi:hypothetical protein
VLGSRNKFAKVMPWRFLSCGGGKLLVDKNVSAFARSFDIVLWFSSFR